MATLTIQLEDDLARHVEEAARRELDCSARTAYPFAMQIAEVMPMLHQLSRADKFRVVLCLASELAQDEGAGLQPGAGYPIWSPHDATDAAATLTQYLRENSSGA